MNASFETSTAESHRTDFKRSSRARRALSSSPPNPHQAKKLNLVRRLGRYIYERAESECSAPISCVKEIGRHGK